MTTVSIFGAGQLGTAVARILNDRGRYAVRGPFGIRDRASALEGGADLVLIATTTRLQHVIDDVRAAISHGSNVLLSAEEAANPWLVDSDLAGAVHQEAISAGVTVVGAGLNPGLIFDAMVLTVLGAVSDDIDITVRRTVDISGFGPAVLDRIGVGTTPEEFERGVAAGDILGHAGFPQSMSIVGAATGRDFSVIRTELRPVVTDRVIDLLDGRKVEAGQAAGVDQTYRCLEEGHVWYTAQFVGHVAPAVAGLHLCDVITLHQDDHVIHEVRVTPSFDSQVGSQHVLANSVGRVIAAPAGWLTVASLPPAAHSSR
jgi:hypothetical protein